MVIVVIGLAGSAFNRNVESELALHDKMSIGPYTLECVGFTQDSNLNYNSEYALLDVYKGGKKQFQMTPEKRVYLASEQPQTMVAIHSAPSWDLYVVYEGTNPDTGQPIIKAFLNPLVGWIWAGSGGAGLRHVGGAGSQPEPGDGRRCAFLRANGSQRARAEGRRPDEDASDLFTFWMKSRAGGRCWPLPSASRWAQPMPARASTT